MGAPAVIPAKAGISPRPPQVWGAAPKGRGAGATGRPLASSHEDGRGPPPCDICPLPSRCAASYPVPMTTRHAFPSPPAPRHSPGQNWTKVADFWTKVADSLSEIRAQLAGSEAQLTSKSPADPPESASCKKILPSPAPSSVGASLVGAPPSFLRRQESRPAPHRCGGQPRRGGGLAPQGALWPPPTKMGERPAHPATFPRCPVAAPLPTMVPGWRGAPARAPEIPRRTVAPFQPHRCPIHA